MRRPILASRIAFVGAVAVLVLAEGGIRLAGAALPEPVLWPSIEADIKVEQMNESVHRPTQVVFLGDSTMESGVDPSRLGELGVAVSSYNASLPWSTPLSMEVWYGEVVAPRLEPDLLYVGLVPPSAQTGREEDVLYQGLLTALNSQKESLTRTLAGWSELYRRRTLIRDLPVILRREKAADLELITEFGFQSGYLRGAIAAEVGPVPAIDHSENPLSDDNAAALGRLISAAAQEDVQVVLVVEPFPCPANAGDCVERFANSAFYRGLEALAAAQQVPILNALQEVWPESLFVDDRHLNSEGVDRFQGLVANSITALGLPD